MMKQFLIAFAFAFNMFSVLATEVRTCREKYATVLEHYMQNASDSLKYKAALFIIDNMSGHFSPEGTQIEHFTEQINTINTKKGIHELSEAWSNAGKSGKTMLLPDSTVVTERMLVSNIDAAFDAWERAPWKDEIDFDTFCRYVLPYRCSNEHIGGNWRMAMTEAYSHVISSETDMLRAFAKIKDAVYADVVLSNAYCPYELDAITTYRIGKAECGQRAIVLVDVLRALGIPAAIDITPMWADYSSKGHGWTSVVAKGGMTYTVFENDTIAKSLNPVDASVFFPRYTVTAEDHCPYDVKQTKTPVKVYRKEYALNGMATNGNVHGHNYPFLKDVSGSYGLVSKVALDVETGNTVYLCSYLSAKDWLPVDFVKAEKGKAVFENVGKGAVCTAYIMENGKRRYVTHPFVVDEDGANRFICPDLKDTENIRINRKYPLCQYTVDTWGFMKGGVFLGANKPDFTDADTLAKVMTMPYGLTEARCNSKVKYRYLGYKAAQNNRSSLSELQFIADDRNGGRVLSGIYSANGIDTTHLEYLHDDNTATSCRGQNTGYIITVDLGDGNASCVSMIRFAPSTDLNFVEKGHLYELYYFDTEWHLAGRQIAQAEELVFTKVPSKALLLLKDKTAGKEERIFEYRKGRQIWH